MTDSGSELPEYSLDGRSVLVTGGTGSFGQAFVQKGSTGTCNLLAKVIIWLTVTQATSGLPFRHTRLTLKGHLMTAIRI